ncbi:nuclear transport factor 2 family protein [Rothia sp. HC945]|uniref:ester cyclase n=1 Tax=Rothia sp. HC945 TaxID=3171170 RepID=UPI003F1EB203
MGDNKELFYRWVQRLWNGPFDREALREVAAEIVTDDFIGHWPGREVYGPDGLADILAETKGMFSDLSFEIEVPPLVDGDMVAGRWAGTGTMTDGTVYGFFGNDILRVDNGKFREYWVASAER